MAPRKLRGLPMPSSPLVFRRDTPRGIGNLMSRDVNLILFEPTEIATLLPRRDPRAAHILDVLRRRVGDTFDVGLVDGPRGKATLAAIGADVLTVTFAWETEAPRPLDPITLIIGLPRPQTARDILRDATALGVAALHFVTTEKSEASLRAKHTVVFRRVATPHARRRAASLRYAAARPHARPHAR